MKAKPFQVLGLRAFNTRQDLGKIYMEYQSEKRICQNCKNDFVIEPEDFLFYEKIKVPPPTFCPECRLQRRLLWRNERTLYKSKSNFTGDIIFSGYHNNSSVKFIETNIWYSDKWDSKDYKMDIDFSRPFLQQFLELHNNVPRPSLGIMNVTNCDYCNNLGNSKNCYLSFSFMDCEECLYSNRMSFCKNNIDSFFINKSDFVYECFQIDESNNIYFSSYCKNCINVYFSKNLKNCQNCFGCVNLVNRNYCIFNTQYSKEEYEVKIKDFNLNLYSSIQKIKKDVKEFQLKFPNRFMYGFQNNNVYGEYINQSKNVKNSYNINGGEDIKYSQFLYTPKSSNLYDCTLWGDNTENSHDSLHIGAGVNNALFCSDSWGSLNNINYCVYCNSSSYLFGCVGIKKGQYMILNKQYTKEEYEELIPKIIKHMNDMPYIDSKGRVYRYGEFFPSELSPFAYNETIAQEYYPLTKEQALSQGYRWKDKEERSYNIDIYNSNIPDDINDIDESIIGNVIECAHKDCNHQCTEAFKIIESEYQFYKRMNLPIPRLCPNCRHYERLAQRNPLKLWHRHCMKEGCNNEFETSYSPDRPEIVYCEKCYQQEVY